MTVRFKSFITESVGAKGLAYEKKVFDAMKSAGVTGLDVGSKPGAGYSNQGAGDIEALYNGKEFNIEIKLNKNIVFKESILKVISILAPILIFLKLLLHKMNFCQPTTIPNPKP